LVNMPCIDSTTCPTGVKAKTHWKPVRWVPAFHDEPDPGAHLTGL
jgi:hypothetical protein